MPHLLTCWPRHRLHVECLWDGSIVWGVIYTIIMGKSELMDGVLGGYWGREEDQPLVLSWLSLNHMLLPLWLALVLVIQQLWSSKDRPNLTSLGNITDPFSSLRIFTLSSRSTCVHCSFLPGGLGLWSPAFFFVLPDTWDLLIGRHWLVYLSVSGT